MEDPPGKKRQSRRTPVNCSCEIAAVNPPGGTAVANRTDIERLRVEDTTKTHPVLPCGSEVSDKANMGCSHTEQPLSVMDRTDSGGRGKIIP